MKSKKITKLWGGRFESGLSSISENISESISFDKILYKQDIQGSIAHVTMLSKQNIVTSSEANKIIKGLKTIEKEIDNNELEFKISLEDIHTHIETRLVELIGSDAKKLHTGRSRNDQVAVDVHLFLKEKIEHQFNSLHILLSQIIELANKEITTIWAGYTHLQIAQPVSLAHYLMVWFWNFYRDSNLLKYAYSEVNVMPLGSAALAGPNYAIDRKITADLLNFKNISFNSIDAVSNRDYQLSYHFFASRFFIHLSRLCEDLIIYNTSEFGYISLGDSVTTGSSIMPQKKNPDIAELLRGKSARVIANLNALMINLKGLPMAYNRDLQEDKIYLFDSCEQVDLGIAGISEIFKSITFHSHKTEKALKTGFALATDLADYLVSSYNISFREAHEITGKIVCYCEDKKITLESLSENDFKANLPENIVLPKDFFTLSKSIERKHGIGSTNPKEIKNQITQAKKLLKSYVL